MKPIKEHRNRRTKKSIMLPKSWHKQSAETTKKPKITYYFFLKKNDPYIIAVSMPFSMLKKRFEKSTTLMCSILY